MIKTFEDTSKKLKATFSCKKMEVPMFKDRDVIAGMEKALKAHENINLLMVVIPGNLKSAYPRFKQELLSAKAGKEFISQFVVENTLKKKGVQSVHTKLLLQMLAKRGNILWVPSYTEEISNKLDKVCIMGIDSCASKGNNVMAACCTINSTFSLIQSSAIKTDPSDDKYKSMLKVASECVKGYANRNKTPPKELIVFMLAVPGDQVNLVQDNFAKKLEQTVASTYNNFEMKVTVIMVNLRNS